MSLLRTVSVSQYWLNAFGHNIAPSHSLTSLQAHIIRTERKAKVIKSRVQVQKPRVKPQLHQRKLSVLPSTCSKLGPPKDSICH